ncbi:MAG: acyl-CoA reductase [Verrucomicrobiota bacterium]|nr:hypothetical protein [Limisphaera sp.]MDW8381093.1 acyl-CoA reductase [Verrucomicrobiota bacterium]
MSLPAYFLADLPPDAPLTPRLIEEACLTLQRNRELYLVPRSCAQIIALLEELGRNWRRPDDPFRQLAVSEGPQQTGFSRATLEQGLDNFFSQLTETNMRRLLRQDLGEETALDDYHPAVDPRRCCRARGPRLLVHFSPGNLPDPTFHAIVLGLLVKSAQFVKCSSQAGFLPRLLAHSLRALDPKLAACLELATWPGGRTDLEDILLQKADCVTVAGADDTIQTLRQRVPVTTRLLAYGHRVSFGYIAYATSNETSLESLAEQAAADVAAWDQAGCLSPHLFYVQTGPDQHFPLRFAEALAMALDRLEHVQPRGTLPTGKAAQIAARRELYAIRAACSGTTRLWCSPNSTAWTVVYEEEPDFQLSCLDRFVYVKPVIDLARALRAAESIRAHVSTVALAAPAALRKTLANQLADWGVPRICPLGRMQQPPLTWHHDGRPALGDLITWTDWEMEPPSSPPAS